MLLCEAHAALPSYSCVYCWLLCEDVCHVIKRHNPLLLPHHDLNPPDTLTPRHYPLSLRQPTPTSPALLGHYTTACIQEVHSAGLRTAGSGTGQRRALWEGLLMAFCVTGVGGGNRKVWDLRAGDSASLDTLTWIPAELDEAIFSLAVHSRTVNVYGWWISIRWKCFWGGHTSGRGGGMSLLPVFKTWEPWWQETKNLFTGMSPVSLQNVPNGCKEVYPTSCTTEISW